MKRSIALAVFAGLLVCAAAAQAQQAITIKLKERGEGEAALIKRNEKTTSKVTVEDGAGQVVLDQKEIKTEIMEYQETVLKRSAGKQATKLVRQYTKVQTVKDDQTEDGALQGKTVIIEKKGDKYAFTYEGGAKVEGAGAAALIKDFSNKSDTNAELEKLVLPQNAVKVGDSWKIDMPKIAKELSKMGTMELNGAESTGKGTLIDAYTKSGRQFGKMKFKMEIPLVTIGKGKEQLKFTGGAKIVLDMTFDVCIDGTSEAGTLQMKMKMEGNATIPAAPGATAALNVIVDATQTQHDVAKK